MIAQSLAQRKNLALFMPETGVENLCY